MNRNYIFFFQCDKTLNFTFAFSVLIMYIEPFITIYT